MTQWANLRNSGPEDLPLEALRKETARLQAEKERLEGEIAYRSSEFQSIVQPFTLDLLRKAIPPNSALAEIFLYHPFKIEAEGLAQMYGPARYVAYVLLRDEEAPRWVELGEAESVDILVKQWRATLRNPESQTLKPEEKWGTRHYIAYVLHNDGDVRWTDLGEAGPIDDGVWDLRIALRNPSNGNVRILARKLDQKIMLPVRKLLGRTDWLFISPDVSLHLLPFEALVDEQGRYLGKKYLFIYLTSGRDLRRLNSSQLPILVAVFVLQPLNGFIKRIQRSFQCQISLRSAAKRRGRRQAVGERFSINAPRLRRLVLLKSNSFQARNLGQTLSGLVELIVFGPLP